MTAPLFPTVAIVDAFGQFLQPTTLLDVLINGLAKGAVYILIATGLTLIFGLLGVLNFAHGSLTMVGAYLGGLLMILAVGEATGDVGRVLWFLIAIAVVLLVISALGGVIEVGLIRPLYDRPPIYQILLTFGLTLILDETMRIVLLFYGIQPLADWQDAFGTKPAFMDRTLGVGPVSVTPLELFEIGVGALTVAGVWLFLTRTRYGMIIRAGSEDDEMTSALGIDVNRVFTVVFALGSGLAGLAGVLLMWDQVWGASVPLSSETLLPAFVVVIVGGLGTFRGTVVAGLGIGLIDAIMTWWFVNAIFFPSLPELTIFLILVVTLIVRPQGLFGREGVGGH
ncbi:MAG: branched-chain amino acid ABC transporter permease [Halobacteriaceae archaeon]